MATTNNVPHWKKLELRKTPKSVRQLNREAYHAYQQDQNATAAALFSEAAELARQQGDTAAQAENLSWAGESFLVDGRLKKALLQMTLADQLKALNPINHFYNLISICVIANQLPLPLAEQQKLLGKLASYKGSGQIGGSKSMVIVTEGVLYSNCGLNFEALAKKQEAFVVRSSDVPRYEDFVFFEQLISAYVATGQFKEAREILRQWKDTKTSDFSTEKHRILESEAGILEDEEHLEAAWDMMQKAYAEQRYIGSAGKDSGTLCSLIRIGSKLGYFEQILPYVRQILTFRHSESLFEKRSCYLSVAQYCCHTCISRKLSPADAKRMHRHARFWLSQAEVSSQKLDLLLETTKYTIEYKKLLDKYNSSCT